MQNHLQACRVFDSWPSVLCMNALFGLYYVDNSVDINYENQLTAYIFLNSCNLPSACKLICGFYMIML